MNRRKFFRNGSLAAIGATVLSPFSTSAKSVDKNKKAKNIIVLVSDGMSTGTLNMADLYKYRKTGVRSNWIKLYEENRVSRALMETASASSIVTDSAAAGSSWGSGFRVNNRSLNVGVNGEMYLPIWQKFKKAGKMAGCVTTVTITHATPAGFCVNSKSRYGQDEIAEQYLEKGFDVMMGGGQLHFDSTKRADKKDMYYAYNNKGYQVVRTRNEMFSASNNAPILGVFADDVLPFAIDRENDAVLKKTTPSLAEMTQKAIDRMKSHPQGFVLQVEAGKVDYAAHANDIAGLLYDQLAFDDAVKVAIDFAEKDENTFVIITTDHGNANPGLIYGKNADANFDRLQKFRHTNEWILNEIKPTDSEARVRELIESENNWTPTEQEAKILLDYYNGLEKEDGGLYNYKKLPYETFANMQKKHTSVGWISMDHSADHVELAMFGPGSELLKPFIKNTDLHYLMLAAAEVENKF
ncbi:MAG: alkaline phosphatase [Flavobacterium sp.]|nr:alkaline phosphatase [Flavobacterium sp.]